MIWDGECGFCYRSAKYLHQRDKENLFHVCQYQSCPSPPMTEDLRRRCQREMYVVTEDGRELGGARGVLFLFQETGWGAFAKLLALPPFIWILSAGYWLVARNRGLISKLFFGGQSCGLDLRHPEIE